MNEQYTTFLFRLSVLGNGDRAALKRSAGIMLAEADGKAITAFYRCLPPEIPQWQESRWFSVACLRCLWDKEVEKGDPLEKIVGRMVVAKELSDSTLHRMEALLDTDWDNDGYMLIKLTRMIKLIRQKSDRAPIDFSDLLEDLIYWNGENQSVRRKWARAVFTND